MSSSLKKNKKDSYSRETRDKPKHIQSRIAKSKTLQKAISSICDNDSSSNEDIRPFFLKSCDGNSNKDSSDETTDKAKSRRKSTSTKSGTDKNTTNTMSNKSAYRTMREEKSKKQDSGSSDTECSKTERYGERREKRHAKLTQKNVTTLNKRDSSSDKEFQRTKLTRMNYSRMEKLTQVRDHITSTDSGSITQADKGTVISKEQSLHFKCHMVKILNKFKEVCSEYELRMERVKWKHFKKDLIYQESASNIIKKSKKVMNSLKAELESQEKKLDTFYADWCKNCTREGTADEESSLSENEVVNKTENDEESHDKKAQEESPRGPSSAVSACDSEEIFSDTDVSAVQASAEKSKKVENFAQSKSNPDKLDIINSSEVDGTSSPILGRGKVRPKCSLKSDTNGTVGVECKKSQVIDETLEDIFDDCTVEDTHETNDSNRVQETEEKGEDLPEANIEDINGVGDKKDSDEKAGDNNSDVNETESDANNATMPMESNEKESSNSLNDSEAEEHAKRAILDSDDSETRTEKLPGKKAADNGGRSERKKLRKVKSSQRARKSSESLLPGDDDSSDSSSSDDRDDIATEAQAKRALLDSNSDDSASPCDSKKSSEKKDDSDEANAKEVLLKEKLLDSSNSESTDESDSKVKEDDSHPGKDKDTSSVRKNKKEHQRGEGSLNYDRTDKKLRMQPAVILARLSEGVLRVHKNALERSRNYLESKEIGSLINLDRLQRNSKNVNDSPRSLSKKRKTKGGKESEDSLLDHLKNSDEENFTKNAAEDGSSESEESTVKRQSAIQTNEELMKEADAVTKKLLLHTSDSDMDAQENVSEGNDKEDEEEKKKEKEGKEEAKEETKSKEKARKSSEKKHTDDEDKENDDEEQQKNKWRRNKLLTMKFSSDEDSNAEREKWNAKQQKQLQEKAEEENNMESSSGKDTVVKRKRRLRRKIMDSDSDIQLVNSDSGSNSSVSLTRKKSSDSDTSVERQTKVRKRKTRKSSDTDSSVGEKKVKPKRRRIKNMSSESDSDNDQLNSSQGTPGKKGRKNIRKVMKDKQVADDTKQAAKEEEERIRRIAERQKLYNEMYEARLAGEEKVEKLVLDFDPDTKEELVTVHENLVKRLKPHQAKGIKFMWDACFESLERVKSSTGSGCIIAHCMGLGKTLQVISLVHTLLSHEDTNVKTVMIVCPLSTVLNWMNEFKLWLKDIENDIEVYEMTKTKKNIERKYQLESWQRTGGVLIIGYEMFRNLSGTNNRMRKNMKEAILKCLIDPGPDVIVCDEGHLLKNEDTALSKSIKRIKTLRRIVLTGTPLQNNLIEYHCMVQFVKPNLLGTKKEFLNRFANPITNGQFDDSTEYDVKLMKKRAYVLHKMLKGCVQRFDYSVLMPFLPPKQEYVIFVSLSEVQINMYRYYLENFARRTRSASGTLFPDYQALQRIWTHPLVMRMNAEKMEKLNEKKLTSSDSEGSLKDFIDDGSESDTSSTSEESDDDDVQSVASSSATRGTRSSMRNMKTEVEVIPKPEEAEKKEEEWWRQFIKPEHFEDMKISAKLVLLFGILKECEQIGDKVLVFSQSLYSLTLIEEFLDKIDNCTQNGTTDENVDGHTGSWSLGLDYFRLDGQTSADNRNVWCKIFNQPTNTRARLFLISTRAGGLGINLTAANRVILFDASWNPSHDVQSIFRVYRFGQKKPCYIYRFLATGTMEEKIYNRQVTKLSLSCRVVDEQQIERHYSNNDLSELYKFEPNTSGVKPTLNLPKDRLLAEIFLKYKDFVENYHEHDSLLENKAEEELNEEERKQAWLEYEEEKKGKPPPMPMFPAMAAFPNHVMLPQYNLQSSFNMSTDYEKLRELLRKDYPNATPEIQQMMTTRVLTDMYSYWEQQAFNSANRAMNQNVGMKPMQMRNQVPNLARMPYMVQNPNKIVTNQPQVYNAPEVIIADTSDDVVEVPSTTVSNKNKNQEE